MEWTSRVTVPEILPLMISLKAGDLLTLGVMKMCDRYDNSRTRYTSARDPPAYSTGTGARPLPLPQAVRFCVTSVWRLLLSCSYAANRSNFRSMRGRSNEETLLVHGNPSIALTLQPLERLLRIFPGRLKVQRKGPPSGGT
jgi:hypothetical protein